MKIQYNFDPETEIPQICRHNVSEQKVDIAMETPGEGRSGNEESRIAIAGTFARRYLRIIYSLDPGRVVFSSLHPTNAVEIQAFLPGDVIGGRVNETK